MNNNKSLEFTPCPICGNRNLKSITRKGQFGLPCFVSICQFDGLVFLSPRWSKERYKYFYEQEYDSYYRPNVLNAETDAHKYTGIKEISSRLESLNLLKRRKSVLDIGAGMGWSLQWLKQNYSNLCDFSAIESSKHCVENIKNVVGAKVISTDVDSPWSLSKFDLIIMRHVLEHFLNPIEALAKVKNNLSNDGVVYIAVPDMMNPKGSLKNYWFRSVHTFYFSEGSLCSIASKVNLSPLIIRSNSSELWGVFQKDDAYKSIDFSKYNSYKKQMKVIRRRKTLDVFINMKSTFKKILSILLPKKIELWLKNIVIQK